MRATRGFTIVEVLVVLGLMSGVALALASLMTAQGTSAQNIQNKVTFTQLQSTLQGGFSNSTTCKSLLAGMNTTAGYYATMQPFSLSTLGVTPGARLLGLPIDYIGLKQMQVVDADHLLMDLHVDVGGVDPTVPFPDGQSPPNVFGNLKQISVPGGLSAMKSWDMQFLLTINPAAGNAVVNCSASNNYTCTSGSCSAGYVPVFQNASALDLQNSNMFLSGANMGIGTTTPQEPLDVAGGIRAGNTGVQSGHPCGSNPDGSPVQEGTMAYDAISLTHAPVYCSAAGQWTKIGGISAATVYTVTNSSNDGSRTSYATCNAGDIATGGGWTWYWFGNWDECYSGPVASAGPGSPAKGYICSCNSNGNIPYCWAICYHSN